MSNPALQAIASERFDLSDLASPNNLIREYPDVLSTNRLRYLLRERNNNGLTECGAVLQKGRRLLVVKPRFLKWLALN